MTRINQNADARSVNRATRASGPARALLTALAMVSAPLASVTSAVIAATPAHAAGGVAEFPIPTASSNPTVITKGPDGALWFVENNASQIGRIDPATGIVTEVPVASPAPPGPSGITVGPDGALWFTETGNNKIGRIDPATKGIIDFAVPTANSSVTGITNGPDGALWFTENAVPKIGRIDPTTKVITEFTSASLGGPSEISTGPDGNLWFTDGTIPQIGRITPAGVITTFATPPTADGSPIIAFGITPGPAADPNVWFTDSNDNHVGKITPAGVITAFPIPTPNAGPADITAGPDGNLWFSEGAVNHIARVTPAGVFTEFGVPTPNSGPNGMATGPDGRLWFTEQSGNRIGAITTTATPIPTITTLSPANGPSNGGTTVTVTGVGFTGVTGAAFTPSAGQGPAVPPVTASFTPVSDTQVKVVTPALPGGFSDLTVTTPGGTSNVVTADRFLSLTPLVVSAVSPASGEPNGATR